MFERLDGAWVDELLPPSGRLSHMCAECVPEVEMTSSCCVMAVMTTTTSSACCLLWFEIPKGVWRCVQSVSWAVRTSPAPIYVCLIGCPLPSSCSGLTESSLLAQPQSYVLGP